MCNECDLFELFQDVVLSVEWKWTNVVSSVKSDQVSIILTKWDHPFYPIHSINNVYTNSMFVVTIFDVKLYNDSPPVANVTDLTRTLQNNNKNSRLNLFD